MAQPQTVYYDKAKNIRSERIDGALHLYRHADVLGINRHPVDPAHYDDPLTVKFDRARRDNMVFASGTHRCLGSHLARLGLRLPLEELLARIHDYAVDVDALIYDNVAVRDVGNLRITFLVPASAGK